MVRPAADSLRGLHLLWVPTGRAALGKFTSPLQFPTRKSVGVYDKAAIGAGDLWSPSLRALQLRDGKSHHKLPSRRLRSTLPKAHPRDNQVAHASCSGRFTAYLHSHPPHRRRPSKSLTTTPPASVSAAIGALTFSNPDGGRHVTNVPNPRWQRRWLQSRHPRSLCARAKSDGPPRDCFQGGLAHAPRDTQRPAGRGAGS